MFIYRIANQKKDQEKISVCLYTLLLFFRLMKSIEIATIQRQIRERDGYRNVFQILCESE